MASTKPDIGLRFERASKSHLHAAHWLLSVTSMRHMGWQALMLLQIMVRSSNRSLDRFYILLELIKLVALWYPCQLPTHCPDTLKHRIDLGVLVLHEHAEM